MLKPQALTRDEVRAVDRIAIEEYGLPGIALMENAGRGCAELLFAQSFSGPVTICCGGGNNGGDGFVIARHLENRGINVRVLLFGDKNKVSGDAAINLRVLEHSKSDIFENPDLQILQDQLREAAWVVDALLGTGMSGAVRSPLKEVIQEINAAGKPVLAIDIPSGMDCDTGEPLGCCIQAKMTATFVAQKTGFLNENARKYLGEIHVIDIGVPNHLLTSLKSPQE